jgi:hypothetical protein
MADPQLAFFAIANYIEAALWGAIAVAFGAHGLLRGGPSRRRCLLTAAAFLLFGVSDVCEVHTGAWWRPWWLLAWKGACVLMLAGLLVTHLRRRTR